ncbi:tyrosine-type recombinase/integrase [Janibacter indicus]
MQISPRRQSGRRARPARLGLRHHRQGSLALRRGERRPPPPPHQNTVGYWWRKTLRDAGLSGIKLHDLRHFYASGLIAAGCDVVTVQRSLGHAKATTTLNTYAHLWPTAEDRTRKAAESIMSASLGNLSEGAASTGD